MWKEIAFFTRLPLVALKSLYPTVMGKETINLYGLHLAKHSDIRNIKSLSGAGLGSGGFVGGGGFCFFPSAVFFLIQ